MVGPLTPDRYERERAFFDSKAERAKLAPIDPDELLPRLYLEAGVLPGSAQQYAIDLLANCEGMQLLDIGAGEGWASLHFASHGATVSATDVSAAALDVLAARAEALGLHDRIRPIIVRDETLPFPDESFDIVFSNAVLHHLNVLVALAEIRRVMKPSGIFVCMEPLAHHPIVRLYRWLTPHKRTPDERPLTWEDMQQIAVKFGGVRIKPFELVALPAVALRRTVFGPHLRFLHRVDAWLFGLIPSSQRYCRAVVLRLQQ